MAQGDPFKALDYLASPVMLISVAAGERRNVLVATRVTCAAPVPSLVAVSVAKRRYSHDLITEAGEFVVNIASSRQVQLAEIVGEVSGRSGDKFALHGIETTPATIVNSPMIAGSAAQFECKLVDGVTAGDFTLFIGEVLAVHVDENARPLLRYQGKYFDIGAPLSAE